MEILDSGDLFSKKSELMEVCCKQTEATNLCSDVPEEATAGQYHVQWWFDLVK